MRGTGRDSTRWSRLSAPAGAVVWLLLVLTPALGDGVTGQIQRLLLLAVLVTVPLALTLVATPDATGQYCWPYHLAVRSQPVVAGLAVMAFLLPAGPVVGLLAVPWLLFTGLVALTGLARLLTRGLGPDGELCLDVGLIYLAVGGGWLVLARLGLAPLGFSDTIVLLTAVHFHYAGFAAPILAGLAGRLLGRTQPLVRGMYRLVVTGLIAGPALVATGITVSRPVELVGAVVLSAALVGLAAVQLFVVAPAGGDPLRRGLLVLSALAVVGGMLLATGYAVGQATGTPTVSIPEMVQWHGTLNAVGFTLGGLLAWTLDPPPAGALTRRVPRWLAGW